MSTLDLEKMQGTWRQHNQRIDAALTLDVERVRNQLKQGTASAFKRHLRWLKLESIFGAAALIALLAFIISVRADAVYLAASLPLIAMALFTFTTDLRHWQVLSKLDLSAPILQVREVLETVRARRLLVAKWIALSACLLWLPLIAVLFKAAFGLDLLRGLHISVIAVNAALGLLLIPVGLFVFGWFTKRFAHAPALQRFIENVAGTTFSAARASFELQANFASSLDKNDAQALLTLQQSQWPAHANTPLRQLHRTLLFGIFFWATLVFGTATFNVLHGDNPHALIPGIFLHLFIVMQMVAGIVHRQLLSNLGSKCALPLTKQIQSLQQMAHWRGNMARLSIVLTPLLATALIQIGADAIYSIDLYQITPAPYAIAIIGSALLLTAALGLRWRATTTRFALGLVNAAALGAVKMTRQLLASLGAS